MGGGDLNFKKSWHPLKLQNQEKVWLEERKVEEEKKRSDQLRKELEEQRQIEEMQLLQEQAGLRKRSNKLDWMYASGPSKGTGAFEDKEAFLLGTKKVDKIIAGDTQMEGEKGLSSGLALDLSSANTIRDTQAKIRDDPLFMIKKMEKASLDRLFNTTVKLAEIKSKKKSKKEKKDKRDKPHKEDRQRSSHKIRRSSSSPDRTTKERETREERTRSSSKTSHKEEKYEHSRRRHQRSTSRSPTRHDSWNQYRPRSRSPLRTEERSQRKRSSPKYRSRSPRSKYHNSRHSPIQKQFREQDRETERLEKERKLKEFQDNVLDLEKLRQDRIKAREQREKEEEEEGKKARLRHEMYGSLPRVLKDINSAAYSSASALDLGNRISSRKNRMNLDD